MSRIVLLALLIALLLVSSAPGDAFAKHARHRIETEPGGYYTPYRRLTWSLAIVGAIAVAQN